jgi:hypothetical protein
MKSSFERETEQPLEGSRPALAQRRDARHEKHDDEREQREHRRPDLLKYRRRVEQPRHQPDQQARHHEQQHDRARVVPYLSEHPTGRRERARRCHDATP